MAIFCVSDLFYMLVGNLMLEVKRVFLLAAVKVLRFIAGRLYYIGDKTLSLTSRPRTEPSEEDLQVDLEANRVLNADSLTFDRALVNDPSGDSSTPTGNLLKTRKRLVRHFRRTLRSPRAHMANAFEYVGGKFEGLAEKVAGKPVPIFIASEDRRYHSPRTLSMGGF
ncbi:MAG: hypothetical protein MMC33_004596 [Icmadophila ericetorum]|nr:hypothetical protein [Icmadophila ericetorum]